LEKYLKYHWERRNYEFSLFSAGELFSVVDKTYFAKKRA
jgi:hypothetical protein